MWEWRYCIKGKMKQETYPVEQFATEKDTAIGVC